MARASIALILAATLVSFIPIANISTANAAETQEARLLAAQRLFDIPTYRQLATRQIYAALKSLPAEQNRRAVDALNNPAVVKALQGVIARSMAQTFALAELEHINRFLAADEARSMVAKAEGFESAVIRELIAAAITDPELAKSLLPK
jgi:hypothetical protein